MEKEAQKTASPFEGSNGEEPTTALRRRALSLVDRDQVIAESR
jgi:hypothetical protein